MGDCRVVCGLCGVAFRPASTSRRATEDDHLHFSGLPSPAAAAAIAGFAIMFNTLRLEETAGIRGRSTSHCNGPAVFRRARGLADGVAHPYPHVVNQVFRGERTFAHAVGVIFAIVAIMVIRSYSVPIICCAFVFYGPVRFCWRKIIEHAGRKTRCFEQRRREKKGVRSS